MADHEHGYPEAVEGMHYTEVRPPKHPTRLDFKCIIPSCPQPRLWSRKDRLNKHWREAHPPSEVVQALDHCKPGRKPLHSQVTRTSSKEEKARLIRATHGFFPWRWQPAKSQKLDRLKNSLAKEFLTQHLQYLQRGSPPHPGASPDLLLAFEALELPYLDSWECLKHPQYRVWLTKHFNEVLGHPKYKQFREMAETKLLTLQDNLTACNGKKRPRGDMADAKQKFRALQVVVSAFGNGGGWVHNGIYLQEAAEQFMEKAGAYFWYKAFHANPREALHEVLRMSYLDWKFSDFARQRKVQVAAQGLKHRQSRLAELGMEEDCNVAMVEGRFADADNHDSENDETYSAVVPAFDIHSDIANFTRDNQILKPEPLLDWASSIPYPVNEAGCFKKLVVQGNENLGTLQWQHRFDAFTKTAFRDKGCVLKQQVQAPPCHAGRVLPSLASGGMATRHNLGSIARGTVSNTDRSTRSNSCFESVQAPHPNVQGNTVEKRKKSCGSLKFENVTETFLYYYEHIQSRESYMEAGKSCGSAANLCNTSTS
ncbi:unnamed protein product [Calypogeia fissa]